MHTFVIMFQATTERTKSMNNQSSNGMDTRIGDLTPEQREELARVTKRMATVALVNQMVDAMGLADRRIGSDAGIVDDDTVGIDTFAIFGAHPHPFYQTFVRHSAFGNGKPIVVGEYTDERAASDGHLAWCIRMLTTLHKPSNLRNVDSGEHAKFLDDVVGNEWRDNRRTLDVTSTEKTAA